MLYFIVGLVLRGVVRYGCSCFSRAYLLWLLQCFMVLYMIIALALHDVVYYGLL